MKSIVFTLIAALALFSACKKEDKGAAIDAASINPPAYEKVNQETENNGDYVIDIIIPEFSKETPDSKIQSVIAKIAKDETANIVYLYNVKDKSIKKGAPYVRPSAGLVGVFENDKFKKK